MPVRNPFRTAGTWLAAGLLLVAVPSKSLSAAPGAVHSRRPEVRLAADLQLFALGQNGARPVVAVPGIGASDLGVDGDFHPLWSGFPGSVSRNPFAGPEDLEFTEDGLPRTDTDSDKLVADGFEGDFPKMVSYLQAQGLKVYPLAYDFRYSLADIAAKVAEQIDAVRQATGQDTVDVYAHSMGTLAVRQYLKDHADNPHVGTVVAVAPPNLGAPKALKVLRYGDDLGQFLLLDPCKVKRAGHNMPGLYDLLPSRRYFDVAGGYFVPQRTGATKPLDFPAMVDNLKNALEPANRWCPLDPEDDPAPLSTLSPTLVDREVVQFHDGLDNQPVPAGVNLFAIAAYGQSTIVRITEQKKNVKITTSTAGDGTVPLASARTLNATALYFANAAALKANHDSLNSNRQVQKQVYGLLTQGPGLYGRSISTTPPPLAGFHVRSATAPLVP